MSKNYFTSPVDDAKFREILRKRGLGACAVAKELGRANNYITDSLRLGRFTGPTVAALKAVYGISPEDYAPDPEPPKKPVATPEEAPTGQKIHIPAATAETGWQTRIKVKPDRLCMTVYFNGVPVVEGHSRVRGDKELDLMQAISYAAHMCFKIAEQKKLMAG